MNLNKIEGLGEIENTVTLKTFFLNLITTHNKRRNIKEKEYQAEILQQLSDRQWHNYEWYNLDKIDTELQTELDKYVWTLLDGELSVDLIDLLSQSISALGLEKSYQKLKEMSENILNNDIKQTIIDNLKEFGNDVKDPYRFIRNGMIENS